jgi:hypothetical protein
MGELSACGPSRAHAYGQQVFWKPLGFKALAPPQSCGTARPLLVHGRRCRRQPDFRFRKSANVFQPSLRALHCNSRNSSQGARVFVDELPREAYGVRPACWRCRKAGVARKREQAAHPYPKPFVLDTLPQPLHSWNIDRGHTSERTMGRPASSGATEPSCPGAAASTTAPTH